MSTINQESIITRNTNVNAGIDKHVTSNVMVGGMQYTPAQLKAVFQAQTAALQASVASHKEWLGDVAAAKAAGKAANAVYSDLVRYLVGLYGKAAIAVLNDFGMAPPKSASQTLATKTAAAAKRFATRSARHTLGKVQKKAVKGDVTGVVVTPVVATATTVAPPGGPTSPAASGGGQAATPSPAASTTSGTTPVTTTTHSP